MNNLQIQRTEKIKLLLSELSSCLKMSVEKAIEIGKELHEQKESLGHGNFLSWLNGNFDLSERTARHYMGLFLHRDKTANIADLHEAYRQVEAIEKLEHLKQETEDKKLVDLRLESGQKPQGWERRHDRLYKRRIDEKTFLERKNKILHEQKAGRAEFKKTDPEGTQRLMDNLEEAIEREKNKSEKIKKFRLHSQDRNTRQEIMFSTLVYYVEFNEDVNLQLEDIHNLIKFLKELGANKQPKTLLMNGS